MVQRSDESYVERCREKIPGNEDRERLVPVVEKKNKTNGLRGMRGFVPTVLGMRGDNQLLNSIRSP